MAKGYSKDLRVRVVSIVEEGDSAREAARLLNVGASTAIRWIERWTTTGSVEAKPGTGAHRFITPDALIGFHAASESQSGKVTGVGNAVVGAYLNA